MKRILVSGYVGFNNFGDEAIFYCLSSHLKSLGYDVKVICNNEKETEEKYKVKTCYYKNFFEIIRNILKCDILISGGGSLLQNKTSNFSLYYYLFILLSAKLFFKKTIVFAQGIEPVRGKFNKIITSFILKTVDFITVRDENSLNLLKKYNIKASLVSDPVYSLIDETEISKDKSGVIIQLRKFEGIDEKFLKALADAVAKNCKNQKISVFSFQDTYDKDICLKFIDCLKEFGINADFIPEQNILDTVKIINNAKYVISTRLHGIIISQALKCNVFAIIYDDKIKTITDELALQNTDITSYTKEELNNKMNGFFNLQKDIKPYRKFRWDITDKKLEEFSKK